MTFVMIEIARYFEIVPIRMLGFCAPVLHLVR